MLWPNGWLKLSKIYDFVSNNQLFHDTFTFYNFAATIVPKNSAENDPKTRFAPVYTTIGLLFRHSRVVQALVTMTVGNATDAGRLVSESWRQVLLVILT